MTKQAIGSVYDEMKISDYIDKGMIYIDDEISKETVNLWARQLKKLAEGKLKLNEQERTPIKLIISSLGGCVYSTFYFCDLMEYYKSKGVEIDTYVTTYAMSGAFKIAICGSRRYGYKRSTYMCHQQNGFSYGFKTREDNRREYEYGEKLWDSIVDIIISNTDITKEMLEESSRRNEDMFFNSTEALELGIIDEIIV